MPPTLPVPMPVRLLALAGCLAAALAPLPALADVTSFGSVNPAPPAGGGTQSGELVVGDQQAASPAPFAGVQVDSGTVLRYDRLVVGDEEEFIGEVTVTGAGSTLRLVDTSSGFPALQLGEEGTGFLTVSSGAVLDVSDFTTASGSNGSITIGREAEGAGFLTVSGRSGGLPSQLIYGDELTVGEAGYGELTISGGAIAYSTDPDDGLFAIGREATGVGYANVTGQQTFLQLPLATTIGTTGAGTLRIADGARVDANQAFTGASFTIGAGGVVELDGGVLLTPGVTSTGRLGGDGRITGGVTNSPGGEIHAGREEKLQVFGDVANTGLVTVAGAEGERAEIDFQGALTNTDPGGAALPGRIAVGYGVVRFGSALTNDGVLASTSGQTDFHGEITNGASGVIAIGGGSNATFFDTVDVSAGTFNIAAGSTALFLGDISISAGVTLGITLDESASGEGFSTPLQSLGLLTLDAPVSLTLAGGFTPTAGDTFELISAAGGLAVGVINPNNFEPLPGGLTWDVQLTGDSLTAIVIDGGINPGGGVLDGDYNGDNIVDVADYTVWRDQLGMVQPGLAADGDGNGEVNRDDYLIWRDNFGRENLGFSSTPTPEPAAVVVALLAAAFAGASRTRRGGPA